jgi:hypothetical protein
MQAAPHIPAKEQLSSVYYIAKLLNLFGFLEFNVALAAVPR